MFIFAFLCIYYYGLTNANANTVIVTIFGVTVNDHNVLNHLACILSQRLHKTLNNFVKLSYIFPTATVPVSDDAFKKASSITHYGHDRDMNDSLGIQIVTVRWLLLHLIT